MDNIRWETQHKVSIIEGIREQRWIQGLSRKGSFQASTVVEGGSCSDARI
ncbi:hypothetical protein COLO4_38500 [Corchorus olitorius]|uniref:Uncharacterized protein n=1 Tax=Corchorus olitorius TaxID=93759 RepID=A0A1R3FUN6_9ROSI|nr:hypothetical protein COLO4_38500 [Corchorus olitorius]